MIKYEYINSDVTRLVTLDNNKVIDERIKTFNSYHNAKQYFEEIREIERKRASQIILVEQGSNNHKFNKRNKRKPNFNIRRTVEIMGLRTRTY